MNEPLRRDQMVRSGGVELWAEAAGPTDPVVLLLPGADASSRRWPDEELDSLTAAGCGVIRFDPRDTGRSTVVAETDLYTLDDLAADAVAVLDAFDVAKAVVIGHSMGGMVAQVLALEHPERVAGLVLIATTPGPDDDRLPGPTHDVVMALAELRFEPVPYSRGRRRLARTAGQDPCRR